MQTVNMLIAILVLIVILIVIAQLITRPIRILWKLILNSVIGLVLLLLVNYVGALWYFSLPVNIITILISSFLGVPGILILIAFHFLLV